MKAILLLFLTLILNPVVAQTDQSRQTESVAIIATTYRLRGSMTCGTVTEQGYKEARKKGYRGCIALSRPLARDMGLKTGKGTHDYAFGTIVIISGSEGYDGEYVFMDLMPPKWRHYRVDIWVPTLQECNIFGVRRCWLLVKR